jgi:hypothetical protein
LSNLHWLYFGGLPPLLFIATAMQIAVVHAAKRHSELITDFAPKRTGLSKLNVMGIRGTPAADKTRLQAHEAPVRLIAFSNGLDEGDPVLTIPDRR